MNQPLAAKEAPRKKLKCCRFCIHYIPKKMEYVYVAWAGKMPAFTIPPLCDQCRDWIDYSRMTCMAARKDETLCGEDARYYEEVPKPESFVPPELYDRPDPRLRPDRQKDKPKHRHWWNFFFNKEED